LFYCEIEFVPYNLKAETIQVENNSSTTISKSFLDMFKQETFTDCVIKVKLILKNFFKLNLGQVGLYLRTCVRPMSFYLNVLYECVPL